MTLPYPLTFNVDGRRWTEHFESPTAESMVGLAKLLLQKEIVASKPKLAQVTVWNDVAAKDPRGVWTAPAGVEPTWAPAGE